MLLTDEPARIEETVALAEATFLVRDLVNMPAGDLGPAELQAAVEAAAKAFGAKVSIAAGKALDEGYPMIAAVGAAAAPGREPRLIELEYGDQRHPRIAIVGKGVCFDSGGLDIKPSAGMRLMKKDMGGAAHALALARLIMTARLPVRLHLLIPAVENAVSGAAFRPGDILRSRKGLSVEIGNTDAEGRLILADALAKAAEAAPDLILDFATLTGAARVALGPDLPALFANDDALAEALLAGGTAVADPLWRMPLWKHYDDMLASDVADLGNVSEAPLAGAVTAALFLQKFVPEGTPWAHLDTFAWRPSAEARTAARAATRSACARPGRCSGPAMADDGSPRFSLLFSNIGETKRLLTGSSRETSLQSFWSSTRGGTGPQELDEHPDQLCAVGPARSHQPADGAHAAGLSHPRSAYGARPCPAARRVEAGDHARLEHARLARLSAARSRRERPAQRLRRADQHGAGLP